MEINIKEISCITCGCSFWVTINHNNDLLRTHKEFYCPNGHSQFYPGKTDKEIILEKQNLIIEKNTKIWELERKLKKLTRKPRKIKQLK